MSVVLMANCVRILLLLRELISFHGAPRDAVVVATAPHRVALVVESSLVNETPRLNARVSLLFDRIC